MLLEFLLKHRDRLRAWRPDTAHTRELQFLVEDRRQLVDEKTRCLNRLTQRLKRYFPQALSWFTSVDSLLLWKFLQQWPDLEALRKVRRSKLQAFLKRDRRCSAPDIEELWPALQQAVPATHDAAVIGSSVLCVTTLVQHLQALREAIRHYEKRIQELTETHPDFPIVSSFPGVGPALAPRLITALGTQRDRFQSANQLQSYSRIAPVKAASGKRCWIHMRWACPKFVRQAFQDMGATFTRSFRLGTRLLRPPARMRQAPPRHYSQPGLQMDSHSLSLLAEPHSLPGSALLGNPRSPCPHHSGLSVDNYRRLFQMRCH